jgi:primosomal protein N' (replication factor Y)
MKKFVDVIVPLPIASQYTYSLPEGMEASIQPGCRVIVPFGPKKFYTAIVTKVHETAPEAYETKDISEVLDSRPVLLGQQFSFWKWLADYYLCTLGDVYKAALPSGMKLESETLVEYNPDFVASEPLPPREQRILDLLSADPEQCVTQLEKASGMKNLLPVIKSLLEKEAICIKEEIKRSYKPRTEVRVRLTEALQNEHHLHIQFDLLARAPKQQAILMKYLELSGWNAEGKNIREVSKKELLDASGQTQSVFKNLVDKQILETYLHEIGRLTGDHAETVPLHTLSPAQQRAFYEILTSFRLL